MDGHNTKMLHHPLKLGCNDQRKSAQRPGAEFKAELILLDHHLSLERVELAVLKSYEWTPGLLDPVIGKTPIPSIADVLKDWADEMDRWHMDDGALYVSFEQARTEQWCRHKSKRELIRFLRSVDFPPRYLQLEWITKTAYQKALEIYQSRRQQGRNCVCENRASKSRTEIFLQKSRAHSGSLLAHKKGLLVHKKRVLAHTRTLACAHGDPAYAHGDAKCLFPLETLN
jgi:hypothetical protein